MPYTNPPSDPGAVGLASFINGFGNTLEKRDSENRRMQGQQALEKYKMDIEKQKEKGALDRTKISADAKAKTAHAHDSNAALQTARKGLAAVQKSEALLAQFGAQALNPTGTNPILAHHITELIKANQSQGLDPTAAKRKAINQAFKEQYPDAANVIYQAHSSGTVAHTLQVFPQLSQEYPNIAIKYGQQAPQAPPTPQSTPQPIAPPKPVSMAPTPAPQTQVAQLPDQGMPSPDNPQSTMTPSNEPLPGEEQPEPSV